MQKLSSSGSILVLKSYQINFVEGLKSWTGMINKKFFPRYPDYKEPEYEPTKLLMVQRIKPFKGNAYWLKKILIDLQLNTRPSGIAIVKNTPEVAGVLYKIKHLVKITPIRTPNGLPDENDLSAGFLKPNGEFIVSQKLKPCEERLALTTEIQTEPSRMDSDTIKKDCRNRLEYNPW